MKTLILILLLPTSLCCAQLPKVAVCRAESYLYVREKPANRSPQIDYFNKTAGAALGSYWCMSFVYTVYNEASKLQGVKNPLLRTASVSNQLKYAKRLGSKLKVINYKGFGLKTAKVGDIGCMKSGTFGIEDIGKLWSGHTFLVLSEQYDKFLTIEGNTNYLGSRNGDRVAKKSRNKNSVLALIRAL